MSVNKNVTVPVGSSSMGAGNVAPRRCLGGVAALPEPPLPNDDEGKAPSRPVEIWAGASRSIRIFLPATRRSRTTQHRNSMVSQPLRLGQTSSASLGKSNLGRRNTSQWWVEHHSIWNVGIGLIGQADFSFPTVS